jgi:carbon storage regulator
MKGISAMLVLSRKQSEAIIIDGDIRITIVRIHGNQVRIGIEAPDSVPIIREELCESAAVGIDPQPPGKAGTANRNAALGSTQFLARGRVRRDQ